MNRLFALACFALTLATPAMAQDRMTTETCAQSFAAVEALAGLSSGISDIPTDDAGWCVLQDQSVIIDQYQGYSLRSLRWRASGVERLINDGLPPRSLDVVGQGFGIVAQTGDPVFDYLLSLQSAVAETGFGLSVRWDGVQNVVLVEDAHIDFFPGNRIEATARIDGVNLTDMATIQTSFGSMGLRDLSMKADFAGWFESYVALPLGMELLDSDGPGPEAQIAQLKEQALTLLETVPVALLPQASRDALGSFIIALPAPRGTLRLQGSANPPLGAARIAPLALLPANPTPEQIIDLGLEGVTLLFTWTPTGE